MTTPNSTTEATPLQGLAAYLRHVARDVPTNFASHATLLQWATEVESAQSRASAQGGDVEPTAWLIEYDMTYGERRRHVELHNSVGDYRAQFSNVTSEPLYKRLPATTGMKELPVLTEAQRAERESHARETLDRAGLKPQESLVGDAERLDWLERQDLEETCMGHVVDGRHDGEYYINVGLGPFYGKTLREAIDAAIRAGRKG